MTDTATETPVAAEVAAPEVVATEAVEQQVAPTEDVALETGTPGDEAQQPLSKHEVRQQLRKDMAAKQEARQKEAEDATEAVDPDAAKAAADDAGEEALIDDDGRKHDRKTGEYLPEGEGEEAAADTAAEGTAEETAEAEEAPAAVVEPIVVPIPDDHFVREMGQPSLTAHSPEEEQVIRALINGTYERRQAVEARDQVIATRDQTILELRQEKVRREASEAAMGKYEGTAAYEAHKVTYETLRAAEAEGTLAEGTASAFWKSEAVQQDVKPLEDAEYKERWGEVEAQAEQEAGELFTGDAFRAAQSALPPEVTELAAFKEVFDGTISSLDAELNTEYEAALRTGRTPVVYTPDQVHKRFGDLLRERLILDSRVRRVLNAKLDESTRAEAARKISSDKQQAAATKSREDAVAAKAVKDAARAAADKRLQAPPHPLGKVTDASRGAGEPGPTGSPSQDETDTDKMPAHQLKRHHKKLARADARRHTTR